MQYFRGGVSQERKIGQMKNTTHIIIMYHVVATMYAVYARAADKYEPAGGSYIIRQ